MKPTQHTLATAGFELHRKRTRRDEFLSQMDQVVPWSKLCALIEPSYPKNEGAGRPTVGLERMLRIYFLQQWFNLSDPAVEEALYDSASMRQFVGIDLGREGAPDETTVCKFRHLLERQELGKAIFEQVNAHLKSQGMKLSTGTIVDASIISAPTSTKNKKGERDPEMHQTKKGNQWYFGMKAHIGVDSRSKLIHTVLASAANVHDSLALPHLLHGRSAVCGVIRRTVVSVRRFASVPHMRGTARRSESTTTSRRLRICVGATATSRKCVPRWSTASTSSSDCSALVRFATAALRRI
jgi:IS5 family transposase